jgi:hypothetical protein
MVLLAGLDGTDVKYRSLKWRRVIFVQSDAAPWPIALCNGSGKIPTYSIAGTSYGPTRASASIQATATGTALYLLKGRPVYDVWSDLYRTIPSLG